MNQQFPGLDPHLVYLLPFFGIFALLMCAVLIVPYWMIFKKAGFTPWLALLIFIPLANLITLYVVAFSQWNVVPVRDLAMTQGGPYPGPAVPTVYPPVQPGTQPPPPQMPPEPPYLR